MRGPEHLPDQPGVVDDAGAVAESLNVDDAADLTPLVDQQVAAAEVTVHKIVATTTPSSLSTLRLKRFAARRSHRHRFADDGSPAAARSMTPIPEPLARVAELMSACPRQWLLCGGWAVDSLIGRQTRDHLDVDIAVFHDDQPALFEHLAGWDLIGHDNNVADDTTEPWNGRRLVLPAHIHANTRALSGIELDIQLNERSGGDWIFSRAPRITLAIEQCARQSAWQLPTVTPQVALFYKANPPGWRDTPAPDRRPHDERDFLAVLPSLTEDQRCWLTKAISLAQPDHPWLTQLAT